MIVIIEQSWRNSIMPASAKACLLGASILIGGAGTPSAQPAAPQPTHPDTTVATPAPGGDAEGAKPAGKLVLLFDTGDAKLDARNEAILDHASRLYREGRPIIMIVSGSTDAVGSPAKNLLLSLRRATTVAQGLLVRGIPAERTQILAKGETNPAVPGQRGVPEPQNRRVEIIIR